MTPSTGPNPQHHRSSHPATSWVQPKPQAEVWAVVISQLKQLNLQLKLRHFGVCQRDWFIQVAMIDQSWSPKPWLTRLVDHGGPPSGGRFCARPFRWDQRTSITVRVVGVKRKIPSMKESPLTICFKVLVQAINCSWTMNNVLNWMVDKN